MPSATITVRDLEPKTPAESKAYSVQWEGRTVSAASWSVPSPMTLDAQSTVDDECFIRVGGGVSGRDYDLVLTATMSDGQILQAVVRVKVVSVAQRAGL